MNNYLISQLFISVKGYLRKGSIFYAMKEPSKAAQSYLKALDLDPNCEVNIISYSTSGGHNYKMSDRKLLPDSWGKYRKNLH